MPLRNAAAIAFKPTGVSDAVDGSNSPAGSLYAAVNLVPSMHTRSIWVPRPAIVPQIQFPYPTGMGEALIEIGERVWGMVQLPSNTFPAGNWNQGEWNTMLWGPAASYATPFCYDYTTGNFVPIANARPPFLPTATSNQGDWTPPTIAQIGSHLIFTHPGFTMPNAFGWIDQSGFTVSTYGYVTLNSPVIQFLGEDPLQSGWRPGMTVTSSAFPHSTTIRSVTEPGVTLGATSPTVIVDQGALTTGWANLTIAGGTPDHPLWSAGNVNGYPLPDVPLCVAMFNGRAWFGMKDGSMPYADAGDPLERSNADQALTIQNKLPVTALATQPFANQTVIGGVMNALIAFQADAGIWQVTGDQATANLALNFASAEGTLAPLTIVTVPGPALRFIAPDGMRQLSLDGTLSAPLSTHGDGVAQPFIDCPYPSRMCAAYNEDIYRVTVFGYVTIGGSVVPELVAAEYWFHEKLKNWSGPHSCPARLITASNRPATEHGFLMFRLEPSAYVLGSGFGLMLATGNGVLLGTGKPPVQTHGLWFSATRGMIDSVYHEDGEPIAWIFQTSMLPDTQAMWMNAVLETAIACAIRPGDHINVSAMDERGVVIDTVHLEGFQPVPHGTQLPVNGGALFAQRQIDWHTTVVVKQASIIARGLANPSVALGNINLRVQRTGYLLQDPGRVSTMQPQFGVP